MTVSTSNLIGVALTNTDSTAAFTTGTTVNLDDGGQAIYVQAASDTSQYAAVAILANNTCVPLTTTNAATSKRFAVAQTSIASGYYGWVQSGGVVRINLAISCNPSVPLFTTGTGGVLDDATVSGGGVGLVAGLVATATATVATSVTCVGGYPHVIGYSGV